MEADSLAELKVLLQEEGTRVLSFFASNEMVANPSKTAMLILRPAIPRVRESPFEIKLREATIIESQHERLLGVHFTSDLRWNNHVEKLKSETSYALSVLSRLKHLLSSKHLKAIANGIIMSRLRYCLPVFGAESLRFDESDTKSTVGYQIQLIQNKMLRLLVGCRQSDRVRVHDMLESVNMLSINQQIGFDILIELWKAKNFEVPHLMSLLDRHRNDTRILRSDTTGKASATNLEPFAMNGARLWNMAGEIFRTTNLLKVAKIEARKVVKCLPI